MKDFEVTITHGSTMNTITKTDFDVDAGLEFESFERLAAKLVKVPKSELDEKLDESASSG